MRRTERDGEATLLWGAVATVAVVLVAEAAKAWGVADWPLPCGMTLGQLATAMAMGAMLTVTVLGAVEEVRRAR